MSAPGRSQALILRAQHAGSFCIAPGRSQALVLQHAARRVAV